MSRPVNGARNDQNSGAYRADSPGNFTSATVVAIPSNGSATESDTTAACRARPALPTARATSTASGGKTGSMYRLALSPSESDRSPSTTMTHSVHSHRGEASVRLAFQPSLSAPQSQPVQGRNPSGSNRRYAPNPAHHGTTVGEACTGWKNRPTPRVPPRKNVAANGQPW